MADFWVGCWVYSPYRCLSGIFAAAHFYNRYFAPIMIILIPAVVILAALKTANSSRIFQKIIMHILPICFFSGRSALSI